MAKTADYYELLGVPRNATPDQIRSAYRKLARQHHPDVSQAPDAAERFKQVTEAYEVLSDAERRQRYDMFGNGQGLGDFGIGDLFETFFGSEFGLRGGPSGDLYVLIRLRERAFFRREGDDLVHVLRISPAQAALGADLEVPTIEGAAAAVKVPGGAQHGQMVRLRGKGVPHLGSSGRGDQLVYLDVAIPRTLTKEQKALYRQLHDIEGAPEQHDESDARGVFDRIKDAIGGE